MCNFSFKFYIQNFLKHFPTFIYKKHSIIVKKELRGGVPSNQQGRRIVEAIM